MPEVQVMTHWDGVWRDVIEYPQFVAAHYAVRDERWGAALWEVNRIIKQERLEMEARLIYDPALIPRGIPASPKSPPAGTAPPPATTAKTRSARKQSQSPHQQTEW